MGKKYIIEFNRQGCIGAGACEAAAPEFWELVEDGKADLLGGESNEDNSIQRLEIDEEDLDENLEAAQACPVNVIHIIDKETGEEII